MIPTIRVVPLGGQPEWFRVFIHDEPGTARAAATAAGLLTEEDGDVIGVLAAGQALRELTNTLDLARHPAGPLLRTFLQPADAWRLRSCEFSLERGRIMGILNLTEDSFSGDGVGASIDAALRRAEELRNEGADIIDVGAETARADRPAMVAEVEAELVGAAVRALVNDGHCVSIDTYKGIVAGRGLDEGAELVNDISGLTAGSAAAEQAIHAGAGYVLNYSYSPPKRRPASRPEYGDVVDATVGWFESRLGTLDALGADRQRVAIDPGIAFGKSHDEDLQMMRRLGELRTHGQPLLLAHSRKNFIGSVTGSPAGGRDLETHVATALAYARGARIFRVHDVAGTVRALAMSQALSTAAPGAFGPDGESWPWRAGAGLSQGAGHPPAWEAPRGQRW